jgi:hypothetical protein
MRQSPIQLLTRAQVLTGAQEKLSASHSFIIGMAVLVAISISLSGCVKTEEPVYEEPPAPQAAQAGEPEQPQQVLDLPPPKLDEVREAVKRVFKDAAVIDTTREPNFIAGDFNGDSSEDIAVTVKPAPGKLPEMNEEFPSWMLKDPFVPIKPEMPPLRVEENESLLAVIHGYGTQGWRDPQATQTYLLKNAAGSGMKTHKGKEFATANRGRRLPLLHGDLIGEVLGGAPGYLYYTGPTYSWYDPKTFTGEPERRLVHRGANAGMMR